MSSRGITWGVVGILAALFIYWQYSNYAHNNQLNHDLGNRQSLQARVAAASELIDKKQFGDVLPTTPEYVHERVIPALKQIALDKAPAHKQRAGDALTQLVGLMKDTDEGVRAKAQRALVQMGLTAVPGAITALADGDAHAKRGAVAVLDRIGPPAIPALVDAVQKNKDQRGAAVDALVNLAPASNTPMLKLLSDKDKDVRAAAAAYFGNSRQAIGKDKLLALLQDKDTRGPAMRAEGLIGDTRALPEILRALTDKRDAGNRRTAIVALGDMRAAQTAGAVVPFLRSDNPDIASVAVASIRTMGPAAVPSLMNAYDSSDPATRRGVASALDGDTTPAAITLLTRALKDPDPTVRDAAAQSLANRDSTASVPPLLAALRDPSPDVAESAEESLVKVGGPAVSPLVATLTAPREAGSDGGSNMAGEVVRNYASHALAHIGAEAAPAVIAAAEHAPSAQGREWAVVTLSELRVPSAVPMLRALATHGDPQLRWFAQDALRHYQA